MAGMERELASQLRRRIHELRQERQAVEEELLDLRSFRRASLIPSFRLRGGLKRRTPAFYLWRREGPKRLLVYVRKAELDRVRQDVEVYRRYRRGMIRLRALSREIVIAYKELAQALDLGLPA